jgi:hypothetical protein
MASRRDAAGHGSPEPNEDLLDPPSLEDGPSPLRSIVTTSDEEYPEEAPTVAVTDLSELGISQSELETPAPAPVAEASRVERAAPRMERAPRRESPWGIVLAAAIPLVVAIAGVVWMLLAF